MEIHFESEFICVLSHFSLSLEQMQTPTQPLIEPSLSDRVHASPDRRLTDPIIVKEQYYGRVPSCPSVLADRHFGKRHYFSSEDEKLVLESLRDSKNLITQHSMAHDPVSRRSLADVRDMLSVCCDRKLEEPVCCFTTPECVVPERGRHGGWFWPNTVVFMRKDCSAGAGDALGVFRFRFEPRLRVVVAPPYWSRSTGTPAQQAAYVYYFVAMCYLKEEPSLSHRERDFLHDHLLQAHDAACRLRLQRHWLGSPVCHPDLDVWPDAFGGCKWHADIPPGYEQCTPGNMPELFALLFSWHSSATFTNPDGSVIEQVLPVELVRLIMRYCYLHDDHVVVSIFGEYVAMRHGHLSPRRRALYLAHEAELERRDALAPLTWINLDCGDYGSLRKMAEDRQACLSFFSDAGAHAGCDALQLCASHFAPYF